MKKLEVINGLRGIAILAVIYHHLFSGFTGPGFMRVDALGTALLPMTYFSNGWLGVNLFFMLSGFVLSYPYFLGKRQFSGLAGVKEFYLHRAARLMPLYYFSVVVSIVFVVYPVATSPEFWRRYVLLLSTATFGFTKDMWFPPGHGLLWSLGIEIWFSLTFPFLIMAATRIGVLRLLALALVISLVTRVIGNSAAFDIGVPYLNPVRDSLLGRLDEFSWGIFLSYLYVHRVETFSATFLRIAFFAGAVLITLSCMLWDYVVLKRLTHYVVPFINDVLDVGLALVILSLLGRTGGFLKWIFSAAPLQLLGMMCYSLYIWHGMVLDRATLPSDVPHVAAYLCMLFALAALSYRYIEFGREADARKLFLLPRRLVAPRPPRQGVAQSAEETDARGAS